jgi:short-subunit dehydrogenase
MNFFNSKKVKYFNRLVYVAGLFTLFNYGRDLPKNIKSLFLQRQTLNLLKDKYGDGWVVISGATSGTGLCFAREFSKLGFNTLLISRDEEKLENTRKELMTNFGVNSKIIKCDFSNISHEKNIEELRQKINQTLGDEKVSIVVNNVGMQSLNDNKFENLSTTELINYCNVNMLSQLIMYNIFLLRLKNQPSRSLIIDVSSSTADLDTMPVNAVYQSTKTFNMKFSKTMDLQLKAQETESIKRNVDIAILKPGMFVSNLTERHQSKHFISDYAENVVLNSLFDVASGDMETRGTFRHKFIHFVMRNLPWYVKENYVAKEMYNQYNKKE